jgi:hypothetical protein
MTARSIPTTRAVVDLEGEAIVGVSFRGGSDCAAARVAARPIKSRIVMFVLVFEEDHRRTTTLSLHAACDFAYHGRDKTANRLGTGADPMPSFQQQVFNAFYAGLARTNKLIKAHKALLALAKAEGDTDREQWLKLVVNQFEREVKMYKELIKKARRRDVT